MAIVRLEFDLDSDVYPELHEALSALRSAQSRTERLRQLAAMGLVWENVRIYGANAIGPTLKGEAVPQPKPPARPPQPQAQQPPVAVVAVAPVVPPVAPAVAAAKPGRATKGKRKGAELPADDAQVSPDFVDLAINAKPNPAPVIAEPPDPRIDQSDVEQVARELPVLVDIVNESDADADADTAGDDEADADSDAEAELETHGASLHRVLAASSVHEREELAVVSDDAIHLTALAQKPAMRSRLMRMKERGLFKNG